MATGKKKAGKKRNTRQGFKRLKALGHERMAAIDDLLLKDYTPSYVACVIQDEWGEITDIKRATLSRQLDRYKNQELAGKISLVSEKFSDSKQEGKKRIALSDVAEDINAIEELTELIHVQKYRLDKILKKEEGMPVNMDQVARDIRLLKDLIKELADLQMEVGILRRAPRTFQGQIDLRNNEEIDTGLKELSISRENMDEVARSTHEALAALGFLPEEAMGEEEYDGATDDSEG